MPRTLAGYELLRRLYRGLTKRSMQPSVTDAYRIVRCDDPRLVYNQFFSMTSVFPRDSFKAETLRAMSRDLGLSSSGTKSQMIEHLQGLTGVHTLEVMCSNRVCLA